MKLAKKSYFQLFSDLNSFTEMMSKRGYAPLGANLGKFKRKCRTKLIYIPKDYWKNIEKF